jgi:hypothetical protein
MSSAASGLPSTAAGEKRRHQRDPDILCVGSALSSLDNVNIAIFAAGVSSPVVPAPFCWPREGNSLQAEYNLTTVNDGANTSRIRVPKTHKHGVIRVSLVRCSSLACGGSPELVLASRL